MLWHDLTSLIFLATARVSFGHIWCSLSILKIRDVCDTSKQFVEHYETDNFIWIVSILVFSHRISHLPIISLLLGYVAYCVLIIEKQKNTIYCRNLTLLFSQPNIINPNSENLKIISILLFDISSLHWKERGLEATKECEHTEEFQKLIFNFEITELI